MWLGSSSLASQTIIDARAQARVGPGLVIPLDPTAKPEGLYL